MRAKGSRSAFPKGWDAHISRPCGTSSGRSNVLLPGDEFVGNPTAGSRRCQEFDVIVQRMANGLARQYRYSN